MAGLLFRPRRAGDQAAIVSCLSPLQMLAHCMSQLIGGARQADDLPRGDCVSASSARQQVMHMKPRSEMPLQTTLPSLSAF